MMDIHDSASVRNLERIQEDGPREGSGRNATLALVVMSGACILFATMAFGARRTTTSTQKKADPLAELANKTTTSPTILPGEVTFPGILSDKANPATALAAATAPISTVTIPAPPPATDKLSVVPLPARHALGAYAISSATISKPKDKLSSLAEGASDPAGAGGALVASGAEGGWQVQVSSFRTMAEGDAFATQLRARGHKAHVQRAEIPGRGTWFRVKIGPFSTQGEAIKYRSTFEAKEKIPGFVVKSGVDPH
jgi:cell division septation protein DedD